MREGVSLWGWVGVAAAEGVVASNGGSLKGVDVSVDSVDLLESLERSRSQGRDAR